MSVPFGAIERAADRMYPPQLEILAGELAKHIKTEQDITALRRHLLKLTVESALEAELDAHLGYERHAPAGRSSGNSRNGYSSKTRKGDLGKVPMQTPRDRNYPEPTRRIHWLTRDHAERLLAELPPTWRGWPGSVWRRAVARLAGVWRLGNRSNGKTLRASGTGTSCRTRAAHLRSCAKFTPTTAQGGKIVQ